MESLPKRIDVRMQSWNARAVTAVTVGKDVTMQVTTCVNTGRVPRGVTGRPAPRCAALLPLPQTSADAGWVACPPGAAPSDEVAAGGCRWLCLRMIESKSDALLTTFIHNLGV